MATIKVFSLGGLDKKSNDLTRSIEKASDMLNMEYDTQSTLKKRNGFDLFSATACKDMAYYNFKDETLLFNEITATLNIMKNDGSLKSIGGTTAIPFPTGNLALTTASISFCENQNNIYFTNNDYSTYVMKYDGSNVYRSGLPTPRISNANKIDTYPTISSGGTGFSRVFYSFKDINGNVTYSPYVQYSVGLSGASTLTINTLKDNPDSLENGFLDKYAIMGSAYSATLSSSARVLTVTKHNYVAGEKFMFDSENRMVKIVGGQKDFIVWDIESVTSTTITFTAASIGSSSVILTGSGATDEPLDCRTKVHLATSETADLNYRMRFVWAVDNSTLTNSLTASNIYVLYPNGLPISDDQVPFLEDFYDSTTLKAMPPICKYIASFGNQIGYGSVQSYFTTFTQTSLIPNERVSYDNDDILIYSDISTGDGPENISELNIVKVGETWDGFITGLRRCNDSFIIFKNKGVFSIDGALIDGEFQLRKINTNFIGCTSHKSILESEEGLYFQGHNGIYFTNGIGVKKLSYEIDSIFNSANYSTTRSVRLKKKQKSLFYVPQLSKIVVIDYYYNQIYIWDSITASNGFIENASGDVLFSNGTNIYKISDSSYSDNGSAINAYYSTTWHHAGEPALNKKWLSIRLFGLTGDAFTATVKTEGDWTQTQLTSNDLVFSSSDQTKFLMLNMQTKRSFRFTFSNNILNENMVITGYEITYEMYNNVDKN